MRPLSSNKWDNPLIATWEHLIRAFPEVKLNWAGLSPESRWQWYQLGRPTPPDYIPEPDLTAQVNEPIRRPHALIVELTEFMLTMSEAELLAYLAQTASQALISPRFFHIRAPNSGSFISVPNPCPLEQRQRPEKPKVKLRRANHITNV